jgi:choline dehydrogenase-like flavoprotein
VHARNKCGHDVKATLNIHTLDQKQTEMRGFVRPEAQNRITLDPTLRDGHNIPAPKVTYRLSENSRRQLDHGIANADQVLRAAGRPHHHRLPLQRSGGWHLMGTARRGRNPSTSVVDARGQAHDANNLLIIDGSLFVTGGAVNLTPTIQALALRIAELGACLRISV